MLVMISAIDILVSLISNSGTKILGMLRVLRLLRTLRPLRYAGKLRKIQTAAGVQPGGRAAGQGDGSLARAI
ncbi:hypothetical protein NHX12_025036 [Muraenolepis orangiensis]|uniref:Uncharacterized protein n=1 Tax=Muraenolepis orangiensis TaxID=630683 RepID=A0A9Q0EM38_9TELE|nr:hypothetical protein NHX12_025036 [Muraenolepis orangiensis]